jgi:hypothetical protein
MRLDYAGTAHLDWNAVIGNCLGLPCTSGIQEGQARQEHVFLIKRGDLLFDNTSALPHALRLAADVKTNRVFFAGLGAHGISEFRGRRNGKKSKRKSARARARARASSKAAGRARHCRAAGGRCQQAPL